MKRKELLAQLQSAPRVGGTYRMHTQRFQACDLAQGLGLRVSFVARRIVTACHSNALHTAPAGLRTLA